MLLSNQIFELMHPIQIFDNSVTFIVDKRSEEVSREGAKYLTNKIVICA